LIHFLALAGVLSISFSAIFVRLAGVSPVTATFFRAAYAVPVLAIVWALTRTGDRRSRRERAFAAAAGLVLALELTLWHESIALIGAGLGTLLTHVQIVFVALVGWMLYGERPTGRTIAAIAVVFAGVVMTSGLARHDAFGAAPVAGAILGVVSGALYGAFLMLFRASTRSLTPPAGPLLDATIGTALGAIAFIAFDPHFSVVPVWPAHFWLASLALVTQVVGWLFLATALPRLPAIETSTLLLGQPVLAILWGVLIFAEHLSPVQWTGTVVVLCGVAMMMLMRARVTAA